MKLLIAGSRKYSQEELAAIFSDFQLMCHYVVENKFNKDEITEVIYGDCPTGVDAFAKAKWDECWDVIPLKEFKKDTELYGATKAPIMRNKKMATYADGLILIWDGKSAGSKNMKEEMIKLNKPLYEIIIKS